MKISLCIPKGKKGIRQFLQSELVQCRNIKDKETRKSVQSALSKILNYVNEHTSGVSLFSDGEDLQTAPYEGKKQFYFCGREYKTPHIEAFDPYFITVIDANEATMGTTDGDNINVLYNHTSYIMGKHDAGGQSQRRFERGRAEALKAWLRRNVQTMRDLYKGQDIIIGGPGMTKDMFINELPV